MVTVLHETLLLLVVVVVVLTVAVFVVVEPTHTWMWYGGIGVKVTHVSNRGDGDEEFPKTWLNQP